MRERIWIDSDIERDTCRLNDFLRMEPVLRVLGTDKQFVAYIRTLPSCISGTFSEYVNGEGRSIAAHIRRAKSSGIGMKPEYSCVPLTDAEHRQQHQHGESSLAPKHWFDVQSEIYRILWAISRLKQIIKFSGQKHEDLHLIELWSKSNGVYDELVSLSF